MSQHRDAIVEAWPQSVQRNRTTSVECERFSEYSGVDSGSDDGYSSITSSRSESESDDDNYGPTSLIDKIQQTFSDLFPKEKVDKATQTRAILNPVQKEAARLAHDVVFNLLGKKSSPPEDKVTECLRYCVYELLEKHSILFTTMVKRLQVTRSTGYQTFVGVADELFECDNNAITWARIVALYAFGGRLALYCKENEMEDFAVEIARFMGQYVAEKISPFIMKNGGWDGLVEQFPVHKQMEQKVWKCLLLTGIGLGLAAAFIASHS